jgi:hypothetical protein
VKNETKLDVLSYADEDMAQYAKPLQAVISAYFPHATPQAQEHARKDISASLYLVLRLQTLRDENRTLSETRANVAKLQVALGTLREAMREILPDQSAQKYLAAAAEYEGRATALHDPIALPPIMDDNPSMRASTRWRTFRLTALMASRWTDKASSE